MSRRHSFAKFIRIVLIVLANIAVAGMANAATLTVDDSGGAGYTSIQAAINTAVAGDTILVYSGTYYENINVNKQLILTGVDNGGGKPVIDGGPIETGCPPGTCLNTVTFSASGIIFEGFTVINGWWGIYVQNYGSNIVRNNTVHSNAIQGIVLDSSSNNILKNNTVSSNYYGIGLWTASNNNTLLENTVLNTPTYAGIFIRESNGNTVRGNIISSNKNGIWLYSSNSNTFAGNIISSNTEAGIRLGISVDNDIHDNYFKNSNNFAIGAGLTNRWNVTETAGDNIISGFKLGGNFWANPGGTGYSQTCADADENGICDSPYILDADNTDYLPLSVPVPPSIIFYSNSKTINQNLSLISTPNETITFNATADQPITMWNWYNNNMRIDSNNASDRFTAIFDEGKTIFSDGWESGIIDTSVWNVGRKSPPPTWIIDSGIKYNGSYSLRSSSIADGQASALKKTVAIPGGSTATLSFYWKVSSEQNYDYLYYCIDNDACTSTSGYNGRISGEVNWQPVTASLSSGTHSIKFVYEKDSWVSSGADAGWIDDVMIETSTGSVIFFDGGETGKVEPGLWDIGTDSSLLWKTDSNVKYSGNYALRSNTTTPYEAAWINKTIIIPEGNSVPLSFYWKVSSERNYDYLFYCIDNDACTRTSGYTGRISGEVDWQPVTAILSPGTHSIRFVYEKDDSVDSGADAGWIDNVVVGTSSTHTVMVNAENENGISNTVVWTVNVQSLVLPVPMSISDNASVPSGYGKYTSEALDFGKNVTFASIQLTGTGKINQAKVYTTYNADGTVWLGWAQAAYTSPGLYTAASGQYGRYFGYIIVVPKGIRITGVTIGYVESPDGVIYIG